MQPPTNLCSKIISTLAKSNRENLDGPINFIDHHLGLILVFVFVYAENAFFESIYFLDFRL